MPPLRREGDIDWSNPTPQVRVKGTWVSLADLTPDQLYAISSAAKARATTNLKHAVVRSLTEGLSGVEVQEIVTEQLATHGAA